MATNLNPNDTGRVTSNSVNVRESASPSANRIYYAMNNDSVTVLERKAGTDGNLWYKIRNNTQSGKTGVKDGYIIETYVVLVTSGGGTGGGTGTTQSGTIQGSNVNVRSSPSTSASIKAVVNTGLVVNGNPSETTSANGYTWYRLTSTAWSGDGYVASNYVSFSGSGTGDGGSGTGKVGWVSCNSAGLNVRGSAGGSLLSYKLEDGHMITVLQEQTSGSTLYFRVEDEQKRTNGWVDASFIVWTGIIPPAAGTKVTYNRARALAYARQFTSKSTDQTNSTYNPGFGNYAPTDCANFVSQCLWAGGMPMTFGTAPWNYMKPYAYGSRSQAWTGTISLRAHLDNRKWGREVTKSQVVAGDIAFTYKTDSDIPHVVFVMGNDGTNIYEAGHTNNALDEVRNASTNTKYYHIEDTFTTQAGDKTHVGYPSVADWNSAFSDYGGNALVLRQGDNNSYVLNMKNRLKELGYFSGTVNSSFDAATTTAVKAFQTAAGITNNDGSVGNMTKSKLYRPKGKLK